MSSKKSIPLCRYCMDKPVSPKWGNGFCSKDHAARFVCERFADWYEWNTEEGWWDVSGTQANASSDDDDAVLSAGAGEGTK